MSEEIKKANGVILATYKQGPDGGDLSARDALYYVKKSNPNYVTGTEDLEPAACSDHSYPFTMVVNLTNGTVATQSIVVDAVLPKVKEINSNF